MYTKFMASAISFLAITLSSMTPVSAVTQQGTSDASCSATTPDIVISYVEGSGSLTVKAVAENDKEEALDVRAQLSWDLPTGEKGQVEDVYAVIPVRGIGRYAVTANISVQGCDKPLFVATEMSLLDDSKGGESRPESCGQGATLNGSNGTDTLHGTSNNDKIDGKWGNDHLYGEGCDDEIRGGGRGVSWGRPDRDYIYGGAGRDTLFGEKGNDVIEGNDGNDMIDGGKDNDTCYGGPGIDSFVSCETVQQE